MRINICISCISKFKSLNICMLYSQYFVHFDEGADELVYKNETHSTNKLCRPNALFKNIGI